MITNKMVEDYMINAYINDKYYINYFRKTYLKRVHNKEFSFYKAVELMKEQGFLHLKYKDKSDLEYDYLLDSITTPVFPTSNMVKGRKNVFLVISGGFSPYHEGHHAMFEKAMKKMKLLGYNVAGCYISPSHDIYVDAKRNGEAKLNAFERIRIAEEFIKDVPNKHLYAVDKWESIFCRYEVNYTHVIDRTQKYLEKKYKDTDYEFEVVSVFGSDNIVFADVMEANEKTSVLIMRGEDKYKDYKHVFVVDDQRNNISSTSLRRNGKFKEPTYDHIKGVYEIRDDLDYATVGLGLSKESLDDFRNQFNDLITEVIPKGLTTVTIPLDEQLEEINKGVFMLPTINLDTYFEGDYNKGVSRVFTICDAQYKANRLVPRDNYNTPLTEYLSDIKEDSYILIDDDTASGFTVNTIKSNLPCNVSVCGFKGLNDIWRKKQGYTEESYDIVDMRDFVVGTLHGGLLVEDHLGDVFRVPYMLPYVNLYNRATIIPENQLYFSALLLNLNFKLYIGSKMRLKDFDTSAIKWLLKLGYSLDDKIEDVLEKEVTKFVILYTK